MAKNKACKLLVVRLSALGDVAMTVPVFSELTRQYPLLQITLLTRERFAPIFSQLERVQIYPAQVEGKHRGVWGLWKLYRELRQNKYDAVADLHNVLRSNILIRFFSLENYQIAQIDKGRAEKKALTSRSNKVFKPLKSTHQRYADVFAELGFPVDLSQALLLQKQPISDRCRALIGNDSRKWVGLAPFAAFSGKRYPLPLMEKVVQELSYTDKYTILFFGGGSAEKEYLETWSLKFPNCINLAGKLGFEEELALISHLDLMVSMDSANAHLAANFNIPVLTLWGLTHPYAGFYPFKQDPHNALLPNREKYPGLPTSVYGNKMPAGYEAVMESIAPETVVQKVLSLLGD